MANYGPETGTNENVAAFAHEIFFTLDVYNQKTNRLVKARVGIHSDFIPVELATDTTTFRDLFQGMGKMH